MVISNIFKISDSELLMQDNTEHCKGVAELARSFANEFGMGDWGYILGLLHDKGKEKKEYQEFVQDNAGIPGHRKYNSETREHAYVGALLAQKLFGKYSEFLLNILAGHDSGLTDDALLRKVMESEIPKDVNTDIKVPSLPIKDFTENITDIEAVNHFYRLLFSCLVDANALDKEKFCKPATYRLRQDHCQLRELAQKIEHQIQYFNTLPQTEVNKVRKFVLGKCIEAAPSAPGIYSLTAPTGAGKTISSIVWAVKHAMKHGKKRIIIALPYICAIIQISKDLKRIFGEENILEHFCANDFEDIKDSEVKEQMKLATENWDYPIVVTTNVQLFESMYAFNPSSCRKLHNIVNSVIILDEPQHLPTGFLQPIVDAIKVYTKYFGVSVLFTTASQPALKGTITGTIPPVKLEGFEKIKEIIPPEAQLYKKLQRVDIKFDSIPHTYDDMADKLMKHDVVLCIVNTKKDAEEIFERLPENGRMYLSGTMEPSQINDSINEIKKMLKDGTKPLRVVTTQLIEAGVDIDFPVVYRQEAGLDSILQASGRCNREGKRPISPVYVFSLAMEHQLHSGDILKGRNAREDIDDDKDWLDPKTMTEYFYHFYRACSSFDRKEIGVSLYKPDLKMNFRRAAEKFRMISNSNVQDSATRKPTN